MARRWDISRLQPVVRHADGRVRADAHLTKVGVFVYHQPDGSLRRELRLPEEVFKPESLASFAQVPVTDDHPPEMLDAKNARKYAVGSVGENVLRDDDHVRGKIGVFDADTIAKMEAGKLDVSCGYNCDLEEKSGVHPIYGAYDAIQRNIIGNHVAIVDKGRAGSARARMDGAAWMYNEEEKPELAQDLHAGETHAILVPMANAPAARIDLVIHTDAGSADPDDLASRNAASETDAVPKKRKKAAPPAEAVNDASGDDEDDDPDDPDDDDDEDPDSEDSDYTEDSADKPRSAKYMSDLKKAQDALAEATKARADSESALATAQGQIESLKKDLELAKAESVKARTDADTGMVARIDSKVALLAKATLTGATVDSKMSDREIHLAVIKHVDKLDVADDKADPYVEALFDGAIARAKTDAAETVAGAAALAAVRAVAEVIPHTDSSPADDDEATVARRLRTQTATAWTKPRKETL